MKASTNARTTLKIFIQIDLGELGELSLSHPERTRISKQLTAQVLQRTVSGGPFSLVRLRPLSPPSDGTFYEKPDSSRANHQT